METETLGKVNVAAKLENLEDLSMVNLGLISNLDARRVEVTDALVETGATMLGMPKRLIAQLGLRPHRTRRARTAAGVVTVRMYEAVRLTIQGRDCLSDVSELPDECPVLIGQLPIEWLDFVVDLAGQRLIGNPAHGGEPMLEFY